MEGTYFPCASLYTLPEQSEGATVTFNFGAAADASLYGGSLMTRLEGNTRKQAGLLQSV